MKKTILTILAFILGSYCYCQKISITKVYIEKLKFDWEFKSIEDSLVTNNFPLGDSFINVRLSLIDIYGSYSIEIKNNITSADTIFYYRGAEKQFRRLKVPVFDINGNLIKVLHEKLYMPVAVSKKWIYEI